jgi:hypothetical protein
MAVIITIMAFGLNVPRDTTWHAARQQLPSLLVYLLSFTLIGIYWNNHHHRTRDGLGLTSANIPRSRTTAPALGGCPTVRQVTAPCTTQ